MTVPASEIPNVTLRGDVDMPQLGLGVFLVAPDDTAGVVARALDAGYRHIDTAASYRNEEGVGEALRASGLGRDEVFITTKCANPDHGRERATRALQASLERLDVEQVDLYLIHWPVPAHDDYVETWQALIELHARGLARAIGVSNFQPPHLRRVVGETGVTPAVNQIELHPTLAQHELRRTHAELGIATEAWSPLGRGQDLEQHAVTDIAARHGRTPAQVVIRWHLQHGNVVIPKSVTPERIEGNFDVLGFELSGAEMSAIDALDAGNRTGPDPETFGSG